MHELFDERRYLIPFRAVLLPQMFCDVLVIGEGVAGQRAALAASGADGEGGAADVIIAAKGKLRDSNTYWAQGGVAAVLAEDDSFEQHVADTIAAGGDLCDEPAVRQVVEGGPARINELIDWGMPFDLADEAKGAGGSSLALGREGGHTRRRIVHSDGDATGKALGITLDRQVRAAERIRLFESCFVLDLITVDGATPRCIGAITHHEKYGLQVIWSAATILASGGCGQVYRESTNPSAATGDGLAMAFRAGAELADMAFMQFHPTTLYVAGASRALITEAVRGEGAHLIDRNEYRFMPDYHEMAELAPRDIVARAILAQAVRTNYTNVYLDCRHIDAARFAQRFPGITRLLKEFDIDPSRDGIPIHPSAHYMVGGVRTDLFGRTNLPGLYACGEVSSTGLHGANRLASNSLLEGLVFGQLAGSTCLEHVEVGNGHAGRPVKVVSDIRPSPLSQLDLGDVRSSLRSVMWRQVGIERTCDQVGEVEQMYEFWASYVLDKIFDDRLGWEVQNLLWVGALITRAALWRQESRGVHFRDDYPQPVDAFRAHDVWQRGAERPRKEPVSHGSRVSS